MVVGHHLARRPRRAKQQVRANPAQFFPITVDFAHRREHPCHVGREQEAGPAGHDTLGEAAKMGRERGNPEHEQLAQGVAEGLGDDAEQQARMGPNHRQQRRQIFDRVAIDDVYTRPALEHRAHLAGADQMQFGKLEQAIEALLQQIDPLARRQHAEHHDAQFFVRIATRVGNRLQRGETAMRDRHEARRIDLRHQAVEMGPRRLAGHDERDVAANGELEVTPPYPQPLVGGKKRVRGVERWIVFGASGQPRGVAALAHPLEKAVDRRAVRVIVVLYQ